MSMLIVSFLIVLTAVVLVEFSRPQSLTASLRCDVLSVEKGLSIPDAGHPLQLVYVTYTLCANGTNDLYQHFENEVATGNSTNETNFIPGIERWHQGPYSRVQALVIPSFSRVHCRDILVRFNQSSEIHYVELQVYERDAYRLRINMCGIESRIELPSAELTCPVNCSECELGSALPDCCAECSDMICGSSGAIMNNSTAVERCQLPNCTDTKINPTVCTNSTAEAIFYRNASQQTIAFFLPLCVLFFM